MTRATLRSERSARFYTTPAGAEYPSVTTILQAIAKPALINWAARVERELVMEAAAQLWDDAPEAPSMSRAAFTATLNARLGEKRAHQKALEDAGNIGKQLHALIEWNLRRELGQEPGPEPLISREAARSFACYERWREGAGLEPVRIEQTVWSDEHGYAGTLDLYARLVSGGDVRYATLDWKTGKAIYGEAKLQAAAYRQALIELGHADRACWGLVVRLPKAQEDPEPEALFISPAECERLFEIFLHVKALWEWMD